MTSFNLAAFSDAVADIAEQAASVTASFSTHHGRTATAFHWGDGLYVAAEETVEPDEEVQLTLPGGESMTAELIGRDPSTGVALLKPSTAASGTSFKKAGPVRLGDVVVAAGREGASPLAVFGSVGEIGPMWRSLRGGAIDRRINLAVMAGGRFEGGPVLDARGGLVGMLLFGPRRRALVIPYETIERTVATLREKGHVLRGYLGASLYRIHHGPVQGAMVMGLDDDGPAKAAGIALGDIVTAWNGEPVRGSRELILRLGPDSAGAAVTLGILRGGEVRDVAITIGEKPLI
ncbi:S1C family serine protease [Mesorhizobium sp. ANAO-SY3R2]|uniref:S1C family serine protease n=1 Tax=Mesorhizobium sp. ANAO-SY3R2 TaxID=3166644 RepID=UPI003672D457